MEFPSQFSPDALAKVSLALALGSFFLHVLPLLGGLALAIAAVAPVGRQIQGGKGLATPAA